MHRFFIKEKDIIDGNRVIIDGDDFSHINLSLRLCEGDKIVVCTGDGTDYKVELVDFQKKQVEGKIIDKSSNLAEPSINVTLAQSIPKSRNMELVVQKATEVGVSKIIPLETGRTIVKLSGKKKEKRKARWQKIVEEAAKQAGRGIIPRVDTVTEFDVLLEKFSNYDLIIAFWAKEKENNIRNIISSIDKKNIKDVLLLIGPEGGFAPGEIEKIKQQGGFSCGLGTRVLRTETAGIVGVSIFLHEFNEMEV